VIARPDPHLHKAIHSAALLLCCFLPCGALGQQTILKVSSTAWNGLTAAERAIVQSRYLVEATGAESFGTIIDNQGVNQSVPGSSGGAALGEVVASATYVDKAFSGNNNYSAKTHLAAILLGGLLGSTLDTRPQAKYHYRYAIRLGNGNIAYQDQISQDPFRQPVGVCVSIPEVILLPDQHLCTQSAESLRQAHISQGSSIQPVTASSPSNTAVNDFPSHGPPDVLVNCKASNLAVVRTTVFKCNAIQGVIIQ